jgi:NADH-quinone oxidoreductase subunit C
MSEDRTPAHDDATSPAAGEEEKTTPPAGAVPVGVERPSAEATTAGPGDLPEEVADDGEAPPGPPPAHPTRRGMFGPAGTGDTSGYGRLVARDTNPVRLDSTPRPWGLGFDEVGESLAGALEEAGILFDDAVEKVVVDRGEISFFVRRDRLFEVAKALRDDPALRYEMCLGVNGVHYPGEQGRELHAVYPFLSITHNRRVRVEVTCPDDDPHVPSIVELYPSNNWHERETYDFFGIIFDGHPALTRIEMPDDWPGHPQRKDYPLGGIPVEYKGATIPPPDERRAYT